MPTTTRTFRVFVSSTFEDLKEERNALQREVFPKLTKLCEEHGARFQAIDLRWGVREEAGLDQKTMETCLAEIERCKKTKLKPNFLVLLGDRYGWRPLPARIEAGEFERVRPTIRDSASRALVETWFQRDDNAVPPEYLLKPRTGAFMDAKRWAEVEAVLHRVMREAARNANIVPDELIKYESSATHQEILKGLGKQPKDREHVFAFFRNGTKDEDADLKKLKEDLKGQLRENAFPFEAGSYDELCRHVRESLEKVILEEAKRFESRPSLDLEIEAHGAFAEDRSKHFVGRKSALDGIDDYLKSNERRPLVIHGPSGSGKSAIMAKVSGAEAVVRRFIGATPESSNGVMLLRSLCQEIARNYGQPEDVPATFNELVVALRNRIGLATADRPLNMYLDALDQLGAQDPAAAINWLPTELPPNCKVVVSTIKVPPPLRRARLLEIEPFQIEEAEQALELWLEVAHRTLQPEQWKKLLESFGRSPLPLYLKLAFEEASRWRSFDPLERWVLGEGLAGIVDRLFSRLSEESSHGPVLVSHALGYLTAARYGLTEDEILAVLSADDDVWKDFRGRAKHEPPERRLPVIVWSRLHLDLEPYLTERAAPGGQVISFYHRQLVERASVQYLMEPEARDRHETLAHYFVQLPTRQPDVNLRKVSELPYHQTIAGLWDGVERTLFDLDFADAKIAAHMLHDLIQDCDRALGKHEMPAVKAMRKVLALALPALAPRPDLALQTLYNHLAWIQGFEPSWRHVLEAAETRLNSQSLWLRAEGPLPGSETGIVFDISPVWQFLRQAEGLIVAVSRDGEVETREIASGSLVSRRRLGVTGIRDATALPNGDRVAWLDSSGVLHAEGTGNLLSGQRSDTDLIWHTRGCIVSVISDDTLVSWDPEDGQVAVLLSSIPKPLQFLKCSSDRRSLLLAAGNKPQALVLLTQEETGWQSRAIPLDCAPVVDADWDSAADLLLVACEDRHLRVAEVASGRITADLAYERWPQPQILGRPRRCALVLQDAVVRAFIATDSGQIACWEPARQGVMRMQDYEPPGLFVFEALAGSGKLFVSDSNGGAVPRECSQSYVPFKPGIVRHKTEVNSCAFTATGNIVSACYRESTIMWSSCDLRSLHVTILPGLTAMAVAPDSDSVITGDGYGRVCRMAAGQPGGTGQILGPLALDEAVRCVVCDGPDHAIASGLLGRVVRVSLESPGPPKALRIGGSYREQIDLLSAGSGGKFWSLRLDSSDGGQRQSVLSLLERSGHEVVLLSSVRDLHRIVTSEDGSRLCALGSVVRVLQRTQSGLEEQYRRDAAALRAAFLCDGEFLAVVPQDRAWIEIWRVSEGLPTVGFCYLQTAVECLGTTKNRIVAGLVSGELASLTMAGTSIPPLAREKGRAAQNYTSE